MNVTAGLIASGLALLFFIVLKIRDMFLSYQIDQASKQSTELDQKIAGQDQVIKSAEQAEKDSYDAYEKARRGDSTDGGSSN